jgi:hypothetical protein
MGGRAPEPDATQTEPLTRDGHQRHPRHGSALDAVFVAAHEVSSPRTSSASPRSRRLLALSVLRPLASPHRGGEPGRPRPPNANEGAPRPSLACRAVERPGTDVVAVMSQLLHHPCAVKLTAGGVIKDMEPHQPARELPHQAHRSRYRISTRVRLPSKVLRRCGRRLSGASCTGNDTRSR